MFLYLIQVKAVLLLLFQLLPIIGFLVPPLSKLHVVVKVTGYSCAPCENVLGNVYLSSLTKNLWYEQREKLDSGGRGTLSQSAGHDGRFYRYAV